MFANPKFGAKKAPKFYNSFTYEVREEPRSTPYSQTYIVNDDDCPPKTLIAIDIMDIPDEGDGEYQYICGVCLTPEDAIAYARRMFMLVGEIFKEENHSR